MVQGDRLEEHDDAPARLRGRERPAQHPRRVVAVRGNREHQARDVAQRTDGVLVVEVPAETLLVSEPLDAHDHRVRELPVGEVGERAGLSAQLIERVVHVGEVLDLGDGEEARVRETLREPEDRSLVEQRVEHAP